MHPLRHRFKARHLVRRRRMPPSASTTLSSLASPNLKQTGESNVIGRATESPRGDRSASFARAPGRQEICGARVRRRLLRRGLLPRMQRPEKRKLCRDVLIARNTDRLAYAQALVRPALATTYRPIEAERVAAGNGPADGHGSAVWFDHDLTSSILMQVEGVGSAVAFRAWIGNEQP